MRKYAIKFTFEQEHSTKIFLNYSNNVPTECSIPSIWPNLFKKKYLSIFCSQEDTDSIEKIYVNTIDAFHKFKDKHLSAQDVDFSGTLSSKRKTGYNVS